MKSLTSSALALVLCFSSARAQELELGETAPIPFDSVVLDPNALMDSPDYVAPRKPEPVLEPLPVLDAPQVEDIGLENRAKPTEKRWKLIPIGRLRIAADDNIFIQNENQVEDIIFTLSPGFAFGWGDYASEVSQLGEFESFFEPLPLDIGDQPLNFLFGKYLADASFFVDNSDQNSVDHDALLAGRWQGAKLTVGMRLRFQTLSGVSRDIGGRVDRRIYTGVITSSYLISEKTSLELNLYGTSSDFDTQIDSTEWMAEFWTNYQVRPKTKLSIGTRIGLTDFKGGAQQTFEQLVGRVAYQASGKLTFTLDGGVEWRQYDDNIGDEVFGVFNAGATYEPFDGTSLSLNAFRRNSSAASEINENITSTGLALRASQRLFQRIHFVVEGGYQNFEYSTAGSDGGPRREDKNTFVKPSIAYDITKNVTAQGAYQYQENDSSRQDSSFIENLVSLQLNVEF